MTIYLSPGVYTKETDLSQIIPAVATSTAVIVGASNKGPVDVRTLVTNVKQFLDTYGKPDPTVSYMHYSALAFLKDGSQLWVTRVHNAALYAGVVINSSAAGSKKTALLAGATDPETFSFSSYTNSLFAVFAENPGTWGNSVSIRIDNIVESTFSFDIFVYELRNGTDVLVETWTVSRKTQLDGYGKQMYLEDKINDNSAYIRVKNNTAQADSLLPKHTVIDENIGTGNGALSTFSDTLVNIPIQKYSVVVGLDNTTDLITDDGFGNLSGEGLTSGTVNYETGAISLVFSAAVNSLVSITADYFTGTDADFASGSVGSAVGNTQVIAGWDLYTNPDDVDIRILINGGYTNVPVQTKMKDICEARKDCIAIFDTPSASQGASAAVTWRRNTQNFNTSYGALYTSDVKIFDEYNDLQLMVPNSGYIAGVYARTDFVKDTWYPPAGERRGKLSVLGVNKVYTQGEKDLLYPNQVNFIQVVPGSGIMVWGQKTLQSSQSALSSVHVRRLLIVLEKSIAAALRPSVFELNNDFTRLQIFQQIDTYLALVKARNGLYDYRVVCDETNNTSAVIDNNELHVDIYLKPQRAAEFIQLQSVITRTGASFEELISTGGNF